MDSTPAAIVAEVQGRCERYSIGKPLGNGTFGTVYEARPQSEATVPLVIKRVRLSRRRGEVLVNSIESSQRTSNKTIALQTGSDLHEALQNQKQLYTEYSSREALTLDKLSKLRAFGVTQASDAFITAAPVTAKKQDWSVATGRYADRDGCKPVEAPDEAPILYLNLVMPFCDGTLEDWLKKRMASYASVSASQESRVGRCAVARDMLLQLLQALRDVHSGGIAHRDLKPANILLSRREVETDPKLQQKFPLEQEPAFLLKMADFGSAKDVSDGTRCTPYVTTRWYRAPEILLGSTKYGTAVDMWAFGSIAAQLFLVSPLFCAMRSDGEQLMQHATVLGLPSDSDLLGMNAPPGTKYMIQRVRRVRERTACLPPATLFQLLNERGVPPCVTKMCIACLHWDPSRRATASWCLENCGWLYGEEGLDEIQEAAPLVYGIKPSDIATV